MKIKLLKLLSLIMAILMLTFGVTSCKRDKEAEGNGTDTTEEGATNGSSAGFEPTRLLSSFATVRSGTSSKAVTEAAVALNKAISDIAGESRGIRIDETAKNGNEIIVGKTTRAESAAIDTLEYGDYVFKSSLNSEEMCSVLVGGYDDNATIKAVNEFIKYLETLSAASGEGTEVPNIDMKSNISELVISDSVAKQMAIIYPKNADDKISKIATYLRRDIGKALGRSPALVTLTENDDISSYPNAIVIGAVGKEAAAIKDGFKKNNVYSVKVDSTGKGTRVYIVGATDLSTLRAVQYFYSQSVVNGDFRIPKYLDATVSPLSQRDPGILLHDGKYYLYSSSGLSYVVRESEDLLNWSSPKTVFQPSYQQGFDGNGYFWAPECHYYNGQFYLFATYGYTDSGNGKRGVGVFRCSTPDGRFTLISKQNANATDVGWITPDSMDAIDGTLYVDEQGKPWMVFVREWTKTEDSIGRMSYAPLSEDLTHFTAAPKDMFKANDPAWSNYKITDGPWLYKCSDGTLLMIWSNNSNTDKGGYTVGIAKSSNGRLDGTWTQLDPLFKWTESNIYEMVDGGHGCLFLGYDGRLYLAVHTINDAPTYIKTDSEYSTIEDVTTVTIIPIIESNGTLELDLVK